MKVIPNALGLDVMRRCNLLNHILALRIIPMV
jgi:hypothetical protein